METEKKDEQERKGERSGTKGAGEGKGEPSRKARRVASQARMACDQLTGKMYKVKTQNYIRDKTEKSSERKRKDLCIQQIFTEHLFCTKPEATGGLLDFTFSGDQIYLIRYITFSDNLNISCVLQYTI